jgi:hypothetical protein
MSPENEPAAQRGVRGALGRVFGQRAPAEPHVVDTLDATPPSRTDAASVQIMAHTLIADLFGVGLRLQS